MRNYAEIVRFAKEQKGIVCHNQKEFLEAVKKVDKGQLIVFFDEGGLTDVKKQ